MSSNKPLVYNPAVFSGSSEAEKLEKMQEANACVGSGCMCHPLSDDEVAKLEAAKDKGKMEFSLDQLQNQVESKV